MCGGMCVNSCVCVCERERERDRERERLYLFVCVGVILCTSAEVLVVLHLLYLNRNTVETFANGWQVVFTDSGLKFT